MRSLAFHFIAFALISATIISCSSIGEEPTKANDDITKQRALEGKELISRGEYLLTAGGCNDCHTPKLFGPKGMEYDSSKMYSGHPADAKLPSPSPSSAIPGQWMQMAPDITAFSGPWGISYAANLTPDSTTGIGTWTEEVFIRTLRTGKHMGQVNGRSILPPMPWYNLAKLKDEDLKAIYAYLRSLPPINNRVPNPVPPAQAKSN